MERKKLTYKERLSPHGWRIVKMVMDEKKIVPFVKMWRQHFIDTMKPQAMPFMWENNPEIYKSFGLTKPTLDDLNKALSAKPTNSLPDQSLI